jgi:hydroxyethylthiazole kinase-like uncharacterized protein yjeF
MKILSSDQIRFIDAETIKREGISSLELMERAATAFCDWFTKKYTNKHSLIVIFSGVGNNGGDGLVVARILHKLGYNVEVFIVEYKDTYSDDCAHNLRRIKAEKTHCKKILNKIDIPTLEKYDIVIDGIFGIGLSREVSGIAADVIEVINEFSSVNTGYSEKGYSGAHTGYSEANIGYSEANTGYFNSHKSVISIDVPSGLFLDRKTDFAVKANETVSFHIPKLALYLPDNYLFAGNVTILDIGLNKLAISEIESNLFYTEKRDIKSSLKPLLKFAHKGTEGHALIIGGSIGKIGSVSLASKAALKMGCGLITAYVPKCGVNAIQSQFAEAMVIEDKGDEHICEINFSIVPGAIGVGVGMGQHEETITTFYQFLQNSKGPMVIDADGLNILSKHQEWLSLLPPKTILTPHPMELMRLIGNWSDDFDKIKKTVVLAQKYNIIVIIKGAYSLIIDSINIYVNSSGTPALATAGSGDVLTGMITSLLAQGYNSTDAARVATYIHGMTADITSPYIHPRSFIASDIIENIGKCYINLDSLF